jgi:hypothetical protein
MGKTKTKQSKKRSGRTTFDWWLALDPCSEPSIRRKRKIEEPLGANSKKDDSIPSPAEKIARGMSILAARIRNAQTRNAFTNEEMLAWYIHVIGLFRADHLWDRTIPPYSELLDAYIRSKGIEGNSSSEAEAKRARARPAGRRPAKTHR